MNKNVTVIRAVHSDENPYFLMARRTAQDERLSFEARGLLAYLLSKPDDWKITVYDLCQNCGKSRIYRILKELRTAGYIEYERKSGGRGKWQHIYKIHELSRVENTDVKNSDVKVTRMKNPRILHIQTPENTDTTEKRKTTPRKPDPMFDAISEAWNTRAGARVGLIKGVLLGTAKKGDWKAANFDVPATPDEVKGFGAWYKRKNPTLDMPTSPATLQKWFYQYRDAQKPTPAPTPISDEEAPKPSIYGGYYQPKGEVAS